MSSGEWIVIIWIICGLIAYIGAVIEEKLEYGYCSENLTDFIVGLFITVLVAPISIIMFLYNLGEKITIRI